MGLLFLDLEFEKIIGMGVDPGEESGAALRGDEV